MPQGQWPASARGREGLALSYDRKIQGTDPTDNDILEHP